MAGRSSTDDRSRRLRKAARILWMQAHLAAIDSGLAGAHREYRRFIILGQGRTGTNYLRGLLNSHGGILGFGEIFRSDTEIDWGFPLWRTPRPALRLATTDPDAFLNRYVFRAYPERIAAVGFKLFYNHVRDTGFPDVRDVIFGPRGPAVLHVRRRNLLKSLVSLKRAEADGRWVATRANGSPPPPTIRLTHDECVSYFEQSIRWQEEYEREIAGQPRLDVFYEDLVSHGTREHARILDFLGVPLRPLTAGTVRQSQGRLRDAIANFDELERQFSGTPWRVFFEKD